MLWWPALLAVQAAMPAPDYRAELDTRLSALVEARNAAGDFAGAVDLARRIDARIEPLPQVDYELAYAHNRAGEPRQALRVYDRVLDLDPEMAAALYDRGELHLARGEDEAALADFQAAAELRPDHWAVHFRLAQLAARGHDPKAFEAALIDAIRNGFDLHILVKDPEWSRVARDPELGPVLKRILMTYGDPAIWPALTTP